MAKEQNLKNKIIAIKLNDSDDLLFQSAFKFGPFIYSILNKNIYKIFFTQSSYLRTYTIKTIDNNNLMIESSNNSKLVIREANSFEIKQLIHAYEFKSKSGTSTKLDSATLSTLQKNLTETIPYSENKEYIIGEISMLEPSS